MMAQTKALFRIRYPYKYTAADTYTVKLTVTGPGGSDTEVKTNYVTVNAAPVAPVAAFTNTTPRTGTAPLTVTFTDPVDRFDKLVCLGLR